MASPYQWMWDFETQARRDGDAERVRLTSFYQQALRIGHDFPDEKLALYAAGRDLARQLGEPWWEMFYEHWVIEVLLFRKAQPERALDHAVRAVFETSKPQFATFPQRINLQMNLASAYTAIDAHGYKSELHTLLKHLEVACSESPNYRTYYAQLWSTFLLDTGSAGAVEAAFSYLRFAQQAGSDSDHYTRHALLLICSALYRFDRSNARRQLGDFATLGEEIARREKRSVSVAIFLMWRALAMRWAGKESEAKRLYRQAMKLRSKLPPPQNLMLYQAMAFHEAGGKLEKALDICQLNIRISHTHKLVTSVVHIRLEKCRLLKELGRDFSREAKRLRRVAAKLKSQAHWEAKLTALEQPIKENH